MHQVSALFLHRLGEGVQAGGLDRLGGGGDFGVHRNAVPSGFSGVIEDVKMNLSGHAFQRLEDVRVPHVIDGNIERMSCALNELNKLRSRLSVDLGARRLEVKMEAGRGERREAWHISDLLLWMSVRRILL